MCQTLRESLKLDKTQSLGSGSSNVMLQMGVNNWQSNQTEQIRVRTHVYKGALWEQRETLLRGGVLSVLELGRSFQDARRGAQQSCSKHFLVWEGRGDQGRVVVTAASVLKYPYLPAAPLNSISSTICQILPFLWPSSHCLVLFLQAESFTSFWFIEGYISSPCLLLSLSTKTDFTETSDAWRDINKLFPDAWGTK